MKHTVLGWMRDFVKNVFSNSAEAILRVVLFMLPLGIFITLIQLREKASKVSSLSAYTNDKSVWQHVFPGFLLISIDPDMLKNTVNKTNENIQEWGKANKYTLIVSAVVLLLVLFITVLVK